MNDMHQGSDNTNCIKLTHGSITCPPLQPVYMTKQLQVYISLSSHANDVTRKYEQFLCHASQGLYNWL